MNTYLPTHLPTSPSGSVLTGVKFSGRKSLVPQVSQTQKDIQGGGTDFGDDVSEITDADAKSVASKHEIQSGPAGLLERVEADLCRLSEGEQAVIEGLHSQEEPVTGGKFQVKNQKFLLTFRSHIDKSLMREFLESIKNKGLRKFYMAHETGDETTPYPHSHVVVDFGFRFDSTCARVFDFSGIHPHIARIKDQRGWKACCKYICKEDKTIQLDPSDEFRIVGKLNVDCVWEHNTVQEALSEVTAMKDVIPTIALFNARPKKQRELRLPFSSVEDMRPCQRFIWSKLLEPANDRSFHWFGDAYGGSGKTKLMIWACHNHPDKCFWSGPGLSVENQTMLLCNKYEEGWDGDVIFINLARAKTEQSEMKHLYTFCENLKDGVLVHGKYSGAMMLVNPPHVCIFANVFPDLRTATPDRFDVYEITRSGFVEPVPATELWDPDWGDMATYFERKSGLQRFRNAQRASRPAGQANFLPHNIKEKEAENSALNPPLQRPPGGSLFSFEERDYSPPPNVIMNRFATLKQKRKAMLPDANP